MTAYWQPFKSTGQAKADKSLSSKSFNAPAENIVDAFTYFSDYYNEINGAPDESENYQEDNSSDWARAFYYLYVVDNNGNIWRKNKDTNLYDRFDTRSGYILGEGY